MFNIATRLPTLNNHIAPTLLPLTPTRLPTLANHITPTLLPLTPTRFPTLDNHIEPTLNLGRANLMVQYQNLYKC